MSKYRKVHKIRSWLCTLREHSTALYFLLSAYRGFNCAVFQICSFIVIKSDMFGMIEKLKKNYEKVYSRNSEFFDKRHRYAETIEKNIELEKLIFETSDHMEYLKKICNNCFCSTISDLQVWIDTFRDICAKVMKCLSEIKEYECEFKAKVQEIINIVQEVD